MRAEYGITADTIPTMSWRGFMSLVHGLMWRETSAWRAWVLVTADQTPDTPDTSIHTPAQAETALNAVLGGA
jgi:hypothetical protein